MLRFFHLADLHFGIGFDVHEPKIRSYLRKNQMKAFSTMVDRAVELAIDFLIIAGDLMESSVLDPRLEIFLQKEFSRLQQADIPCYLVMGNHDAAHDLDFQGVRKIGSQLEMIEKEHYRLVAISYADARDMRSIGKILPTFHDDKITIGCFHGVVESESASLDRSYQSASLQELKNVGYDYMALGHVHERGGWDDARIHYPGSFFPLSRRELGERGYLDVRLADHADVRFIASSHFEIRQRDMALQSGSDFRSKAYSQLSSPFKKHREIFYRIRLKGMLTLEEYEDLQEILNMISEEQHLPPEWIDEIELYEELERDKNLFLKETFSDLERGLDQLIDEQELFRISPPKFRHWLQQHPQLAERILIESLTERRRA